MVHFKFTCLKIVLPKVRDLTFAFETLSNDAAHFTVLVLRAM